MRLYHVITTYHLLCAITMQASTSEDAVLLMPKWIPIKYPNYLKLEAFFKEMIIFDNGYRYKNSKEDTKQYFLTLLKSFDRFSEIYVWGAQLSFGIMLAENGIAFHFCEEATGMLTRPEILQHIEKLDPVKSNYFEYVNGLGLYTGENGVIKTVVCNKAAQLKELKGNHISDFSIVKALNDLPENRRNQILTFFTDCKNISVPVDATVIFTQHFANLRLATLEDQALLYQMMVDYFFEDASLVFKPHPDDLLYYSCLFPGANIIHERFPSEFLPFLLDQKPACVATVYSTAVYNLRGYYPEVFELDDSYEREFKKMHRYYCALQIGKLFSEQVYHVNTNNALMTKLAEKQNITGVYVDDSFCCTHHIAEPIYVIVDDVAYDKSAEIVDFLKNLHRDSVVIFTNNNHEYCWNQVGDKDIWSEMIPVVISKTRSSNPVSDECYTTFEEEVLFVYSKNPKLRDDVRSMMMDKKLLYTGIDVKKIPLDHDKERIKMLEGILEATEQRLLYYMDRVKELEKK